MSDIGANIRAATHTGFSDSYSRADMGSRQSDSLLKRLS